MDLGSIPSEGTIVYYVVVVSVYTTTRLFDRGVYNIYDLYMPQVKCKICNREFYVKPCHQKRGHGKYCSKVCSAQGQKNGRYVLCEGCGAQVWRTPKHFRKSKSGKFFCGKSCQTKWRNKKFSGEKHPNWKGGEYVYQRVMKGSGIKPVCKRCGIKNKKVLVIHHIDRNRKNYDISNLMWLCRNCHYLEHNGKTF